MMQKPSKQITDLKIMIIEKHSLMRLSNKCEQPKKESVNPKTGQQKLSSLRKKQEKRRIIKANMGFIMQNVKFTMQNYNSKTCSNQDTMVLV